MIGQDEEERFRVAASGSGEERLASMVMREMGAFRKEVRESLSNLVTREAFQAEKERVNERMGDIREDIHSEAQARERAVQAEREARDKALGAEKEKRMAVEAEQEKARGRMRWMFGAALIPLAFMLMQYALDAMIQGG